MKQLACLLTIIAVLFAIDSASADVHDDAHSELWRSHPQHASIVVAGTFEDGEHGSEDAATLGFDYEYRLNRIVGLGLVAEHAFSPIDVTTLFVVADLHVWRGLAIQTGPGVALFDDSDAEDEFVYRIGALYEFEYGKFTISPQLHLDIGDETDSLILAIAFGFGF